MAETLQEFILGITFGKADEKNLEKAKASAEKAAKDTEAAYKHAAKEVEKAQEAAYRAIGKEAKQAARDAVRAAQQQAKAAKEAAAEATAAFKKASAAAKDASDQQRDNAIRVRDMWSTVGKAGAAAFVGGVVAGTHAIVEQATAVREWEARLGDGAETLQKIGGAAKLLGVDSEIAFKAIQKLRVGIGEGTAAEPLSAIGLDANTLAGMGAEDQLRAIADGLQLVGSDAERTAIAVKLFGEEGGKLVPVLAGGAIGFDELTRAAVEAGHVMSGETLKAAQDFDRQLNETTIKAKGFAATILGDVLPAVTGFADDVGVLTDALGDLVTSEEESADEADEAGSSWLGWALYLSGPVYQAVLLISSAVGLLSDELRTMDDVIRGSALGARLEVAAQVAAKQRDILISNKLIGQSQVATADVFVQESVRLGKKASDIVKGRKKGSGARKKRELDFLAEDFEAEELFGEELRKLGAQGDVGEVAISAAIKAGGDALRKGDNADVARKAALSRLSSSTGQDYSKRAGKDPLLSEIFGEDVPDIELSSLAMGAQPQTLIATINNTFNTEIKNEINGAGNPAQVASQIRQEFQQTLSEIVSHSTKTATVPWAR